MHTEQKVADLSQTNNLLRLTTDLGHQRSITTEAAAYVGDNGMVPAKGSDDTLCYSMSFQLDTLMQLCTIKLTSDCIDTLSENMTQLHQVACDYWQDQATYRKIEPELASSLTFDERNTINSANRRLNTDMKFVSEARLVREAIEQIREAAGTDITIETFELPTLSQLILRHTPGVKKYQLEQQDLK